MSFNDECRAWFECPKCGMRFERYGKTLSEIRFGTCMNCGYERNEECDNKHDDKIKKQMTIRKAGLALLVLGIMFCPIACILHYMLLAVSSMFAIQIGLLMIVRSFLRNNIK